MVDLKHDLSEVPASFNLAATQLAAAILDRRTGRQMSRMAWGLLPHWAKAQGLWGYTINARIETVATKPAFRAVLWKCIRLYCRRATSAPSPSSPETAATCQPTSMAISRIAASSIAQRVIA